MASQAGATVGRSLNRVYAGPAVRRFCGAGRIMGSWSRSIRRRRKRWGPRRILQRVHKRNSGHAHEPMGARQGTRRMELERGMETDRRRRDRGPAAPGIRIVGSIGMRRPRTGQSRLPLAHSPARESALVARVAAVLRRTPRCWVRNLHGGPYQAGLPDFIGSLSGRCFAVECKRRGETPTALQASELRKLRASGAEAVWVDSFSEFLAWWEGWRRVPPHRE
jgi:hypothetical protein